jgi:hypothetical protein
MWLTTSVHVQPGDDRKVLATAYEALKQRNFRPVAVHAQCSAEAVPIGFQLQVYNNVGYPARTFGPFLVAPGSTKSYHFRWPIGEWWNAGTSNTLYQVFSICLTDIKQQADAEGIYLIRVKVLLSDFTFSTSCPSYALPSPHQKSDSDDDVEKCFEQLSIAAGQSIEKSE